MLDALFTVASTLSQALLLTAAVPPGEDGIALVGGTVHTMVPGEEPRVATVIVEDGRVTRVGPDLEIPAGIERVDVSGQHVLPALIDGYVNFDPDHDALYTAAGIGLVRDIGGDRLRMLEQREEHVRARALGPSLLTAGALLDGDPPSTATAVVLRDLAAVDGLVPILIEEKVDFLSVFLGLEPDVLRRTIEVGHENGLEVWGPVPRKGTIQEAVAAEIDGIHFLDGLLPKGVIWDIVQLPAFDGPVALLAESQTAIAPLLLASAIRLENQSARKELGELVKLLHPSYELWWKNELVSRVETMNEDRLRTGQRIVEKQATVLAKLHEAGVPLLVGSASPQPWLFPGQALHKELALWVKAGLEPGEVLRLATRGAAEILGVEADYGSIQPGAVGSFLIVDADPREDIAALADSRPVVVNRGQVLTPEAIEDMLKRTAERQAGAREELNRPIEVEAPPTPEGVLVLDGVVETQAFGLRMSTERFRVVRIPEEEKIVFVGRIVYPQEPGAASREMIVSQVLQNGLLLEIEIALRSGEDVLIHQGIWTANRWRMQRQLGDQKLPVQSTQARPVCAEVGTVTTLLVLGQSPLADVFPVVAFHEFLEPEVVQWRMELDNGGNHQVRTNIGRKAFRFNDVGALALAVSAIGASGVQTVLVESDSFGGPGLPLPLEKRRLIEARMAAAEFAPRAGGEGEDEEPAEPAPDETGDDPTESGEEGDDGEEPEEPASAGDGR